MRHRSLVSAICSQHRQRDKRKKQRREVQRGKLFACESKDFFDHSGSERDVEKRSQKRTGSRILEDYISHLDAPQQTDTHSSERRRT